jgi:hypothetical protein
MVKLFTNLDVEVIGVEEGGADAAVRAAVGVLFMCHLISVVHHYRQASYTNEMQRRTTEAPQPSHLNRIVRYGPCPRCRASSGARACTCRGTAHWCN